MLPSRAFVPVCQRGGRQRRSAAFARSLIASSVLVVVATTAALVPLPAMAVEAPPAGNAFAIQTNGPNGLVTLGDWYSSSAIGAGAGYHYVRFTVPCGWPAGLPVYVDLFSPEMNRVSGALAQSEEPNGAYDSTQFELYGPGATVGPGYTSPAPGAGIPGTRTTFQPGAAGVPEAWMRYATLAAPVACGSYVVRSQVLTADPLNPAGTGDDQNGWRIRVGTDSDADPTNAPPANYDNPDGIVGTNDELTLGVDQASFQQDSGALACQTFFEYVSPGLASIAFNNFDMDGNTRVRYYAPSDPSYDPNANAGGVLGTLSNNGEWNGGTLATRVGDSILNPESGWWRFVTCISSQNQFIQEGEVGRAAYYTQPPTPKLTIAKSDGLATVAPGQTITYTIDVNNVAAGVTAGAANNVVVHDILPAGVTYQSCGSPVPAQGTWACSESGGNVTFTQSGWINAGAAAQLTVTARVNQGASGSIVNNATADYKDQIGDPFLQLAASDTDTVTPAADLSIAKTDSADPVNPGQAFTYTLTVTNNGPSDASGLTVSDTVPPQFTVTGASSGAGSCGNVGNVVTCTLPTLANAGTWAITVNVTVNASTPGGTYTNTATVSTTTADPVPGNDSASQPTTVNTTADLSIAKTDSADPVNPGQAFTYTLTVTNNGPSDASGLTVSDTVPPQFTVTGASSGAGSCGNVGNVVTCTLPTLANAGTWAITVNVTVNASTPGGTYTNTATVSTTTADPVPGNDSASQPTTVNTTADLSIAKTDSADPVNPGQAFTYTLTVTNNGPSDASGLTVSDTVPVGFTISSVTSALGSCGYVGNLAICTLPLLPLSGTWTITVNVTVNASTPGGLYTNTATVSTTTADPAPGNNTATEDTVVTPAADLSIAKTDSADPVNPGQAFTYTLTVTNNGPSDASGLTVSDTVPPQFTVTGASSGAGSCGNVGNVVTCTLPTLANAGTWAITVNVTVNASTPGGTYTNTATVSTTTADPVPGNDSASQGRLRPDRFRHGAAAVHRHGGELGCGQLRQRRQRGDVHPAHARQRRDLGDHRERHRERLHAGWHLHEHRHREHDDRRPGARQRLGLTTHDRWVLVGSRDHEVGRSRERQSGRIGDLRDHPDEQRAACRSRRDHHHGHDPQRHDGDGVGGRLLHQRLGLHVCDLGCPGRRRVGHVPADGGRARRVRPDDAIELCHDRVVPYPGCERG